MKTYIHQLWLVLMSLLLLAGLFLPVGLFFNDEGATAKLTNFRLNFVEGDSVGAMWALAVLLIAALLITLFVLMLSFYRNFTLQKRLLIFDMLLFVGYYIIYILYVVLMNDGASFRPLIAAAFPFAALVLAVITFSCVQRLEAAIIAGASSFRLRE